MTRILFIVVVALWLSGKAAVHAQGQDEVAKQLRKFGISGYPLFPLERDIDHWTAEIDGSRPDFPDAARFLRRFKNLEKIRLDLGATKLTDEKVKLIKDLPTVKRLDISATQLSGQEMQEIASLKQVEYLTLESQEFSPAYQDGGRRRWSRPRQVPNGSLLLPRRPAHTVAASKASGQEIADGSYSMLRVRSR